MSSGVAKYSSRTEQLEIEHAQITGNFKDSTDLITRWTDLAVGVIGRETVESRYESQLEAIRSRARGALSELDQVIQWAPREDVPRLEFLRARTRRIAMMTLESPSLEKQFRQTDFWSAGKRAIEWGIGITIGVSEWVTQVITSAIDLLSFLSRYSLSITGISPGYHEKIHEQIGQFTQWYESTPGEKKWELISELFQKEITRISLLPTSEQSREIGKIAGKIIWYVAVVKAWVEVGSALTTANRHLWAARAFEEISGNTLRSSRLEKVIDMRSRVQTGKTLLIGTNMILGGVAETILWAALSKTTAATLWLLMSWKGSVHYRIEKLDELMTEVEKQIAVEKGARRSSQLHELHDRLLAEEEKLMTEIKMGTTTIPENWGSVLTRRGYGELSRWNREKRVQDLLDKLEHPEGLKIRSKPVTPSASKESPLSPKWSLFDTNAQRTPPTTEVLRSAAEWYRSALWRVSELMHGIDDWALMSSSALFLGKRRYHTLPDDIDINMDARSFPILKERLLKMQKAGKITPPKIETMSNYRHIYGKWGMPAKEADFQASLGNVRVSFDIITDSGQKIEAEVFVGAKGKGFTQIGHVERRVEYFEINGRRVQYLSEGDIAEGYLINFMDESSRNSLDRIRKSMRDHLSSPPGAGWPPTPENFRMPKNKDSVRILNILTYLEDARIKSPDDIIPLLRATIAKFRAHNNGLLAGELRRMGNGDDTFATLEREITAIVHERYALPREQASIILPDFETFRSGLDTLRKQIALLSVQRDRGVISAAEGIRQLEDLDRHVLADIGRLGRDNASFPYFYELSNLRRNYINILLDEFRRANTTPKPSPSPLTTWTPSLH